jgi:hypothetical protein
LIEELMEALTGLTEGLMEDLPGVVMGTSMAGPTGVLMEGSTAELTEELMGAVPP